MKLTFFAVFLMAVGSASAGTILTLEPADGGLFGSPGATVGWGFRVQPDATLWTSFVTSFTISETGPLTGSYSDNIGLLGGPVNFVLAPGGPNWVQAFSLSGGTGLGSYTIDAGVPIGAVDSGILVVQYQSFTGDPNVCGSCFASSGEFDAAFRITATAPEPGTAVLGLAAIGWIVFRRFRSRSSPGCAILGGL